MINTGPIERRLVYAYEDDLAALRAEIERLRAVVTVFEADEAKWMRVPEKGAYCYGKCIAPELRAALNQQLEEKK